MTTYLCKKAAIRCLNKPICGLGLNGAKRQLHISATTRSTTFSKTWTGRPAIPQRNSFADQVHTSNKKIISDEFIGNKYDKDAILFYKPSGQLVALNNVDDIVLLVNDNNSNSGLKEPIVISVPTSVGNVNFPNKLLSVERITEVESVLRRPCANRKSEQVRHVNVAIAPIEHFNRINKTALVVQLKKLPKCYMMLSKIRLTALVVLTEMGGYAMAPELFDPSIFVLAALGTAGLSCAANTVNQFFEVPYDAQMDRTKHRVLVRGLITGRHAVTFAVTCATLGLSTLYFGVNGLTASLGCLNLFLYTLVYTPMKRVSIANTWLGSIVGAIPPVMGWTACTGTLDPGGLLLGAILYAWQFPHFNALSWNLKGDYSKAGYRMMSVTNPDLCRRTALRYSIVMIGLCSLVAPLVDLTTWTFAVDSFPLNVYLAYLAWKFYRDADSSSSRKLFRFSLVHLPALMLLLLISKKYHKSTSETSMKL